MKFEGLAVESVSIDLVIPYARNPRKNMAAVPKVVASIKEFGWRQPIVTDKDLVIIAGHTRLLAARVLGCEEVPVHRAVNLTPIQVKAYRLVDNRSNEDAEWDPELLGLELQDLKLDGFDLGITGFEDAELEALLIGRTVGLTDPDDLPEHLPAPISKPGDVWLLGHHRLMAGDSCVAKSVGKLLGKVCPNLMVTDPPYGVNYDPAWRIRAGVGSADPAVGVVLNDDRADWREAWALFPGNIAYVWHAGLHSHIVNESLISCKFEIRAQIVWVKTRHVLSRGHYHHQHEPCFYAMRDGAEDDNWRFSPDHELVDYAVRVGQTGDWHGGRKQSTVWFIEHVKSETGHGTQKPVEAMRRPIENNSSPGQGVYEPFSGSGTTIIACETTGRICYAMELSEAYVDMAVMRWQNFVGKAATLESSGASFDEIRAAAAPRKSAGSGK